MTRVFELDALRGFALFGIVLGNVLWFSGYAVAPEAAVHATKLDPAVVFAVHMFVDGKFYALFSVLFGASFSQMVQREQRGGRAGRGLVARRLGSLFVVGGAHAVLLWFGDILSLYAVAAVPLYLLSRRSDEVVLRWAIGLLCVPVVTSVVLLTVADPSSSGEVGYGPASQLPGFASESYRDLLAANYAFLERRWALALASGRLPRLLGLFLLGVYLLRRRPVPTPEAKRWLGSVAIASNIALALLADVPAQPPSGWGVLRDVVMGIAVPTGCLAYLSVLWPAFASRGRVAVALAQAGRLSLTHYLSQSLVLAALFYGCALGLWGQLGATWAVALGGGLAVLQILGSGPWRQRFGAGPGERALRALDRALDRGRARRG